jgi:glycosyltransferase involved in cell wall biosynthesis
MQPYASAAAGAKLSAALDIPWVADIGDPWALDDMIAYPTGLHRRRAVRQMRRTLATASAVVMNAPEAAELFRSRLPELEGKLVTAIPNGYEAADFLAPLSREESPIFKIVHTGYFHTGLARRYGRFRLLRRILGGHDPDVDVLARSHVFLLEAVRTLLERRPDLHGKVEVHFAGVMSPADEAVLGELPFVRELGYVDHGEAVRLVRVADLLFLPMYDLPAGRRATIIPGKTYEYLASGTPILAGVPDGDLRDLLSAAGNASLCRPRDVDCLADEIEQRVDRRRKQERTNTQVVEQFTYANLTCRLAEVFDHALGSQRGDTAGASARRSA